MKIYLDSAKVDLIASAVGRFPIDGVTTNPTIIARDIKDGMTVLGLLERIRSLTEGKKLFVQVTSDDADGIVADAMKIVSLGGDITVKVPTTAEGMTAIMRLADKGISTAATACYSTSQALLAAKSGADFVAPYISHIDNLSLDGAAVASEMAELFAFHGLKTEVLAASFRTVSQVERCIAGGVTAVTVTYDMLGSMIAHPGTDREMASFKANWAAKFGESGIADLI